MKLNRYIYNDVVKDIKRREIAIIMGPRQVGKTTILVEVGKYIHKNGTPNQYFNLEMPQDANYFARDFEIILNDIGTKKQTILIDEFHYLPNATKLFKAIYDGYKKIKVIASGSSAIEIHKHLKESLAGRRRVYRVYPLSLRNGCQANQII